MCRKCYPFVVGLSDTYLHPCMPYLVPQCTPITRRILLINMFLTHIELKRNDPRCGSTCTRVAGSDWANWCRMLIICAAIEIARRGHSTTALSMGTYILARRSRYLFCGLCRSSLNFRAWRPSTFIWCCPLGLCRFHVVARMWPLQRSQSNNYSELIG